MSTKAVYFIYDTETGGLDHNVHSLLTFYGAFLDENLNPIDEIDLKLKPKDGIYHVTAGALAVNKINLVQHDKEAVTYEDGAMMLWEKLAKHSDNGRTKLIPVGHNTQFDKGFTVRYMIPDVQWRKVLDYHSLDTVTLAYILKLAGKINTRSLSLGPLAKAIGVQVNDSDLHGARVDTMTDRDVLIKMINMVK